jgi:ribonuclease Z
MHLLGRTTPLHIYAHEPLEKITIAQLGASHSFLRFEVVWHHLNSEEPQVVFENSRISVSSFPLNHKVPTVGYKFEEKSLPRNIIPEVIERYKIPIPRIRQIKAGADLKLEDGTVIPNAELTTAPKKASSYAFCTDSAYHVNTVKAVKGVNLLYHEATFLEVDASRAKQTYHSTAKDAARVAKEAGVGRLLLGHFSARYRKDEPFLTEAGEIFPNTLLANEGLVVPVDL